MKTHRHCFRQPGHVKTMRSLSPPHPPAVIYSDALMLLLRVVVITSTPPSWQGFESLQALLLLFRYSSLWSCGWGDAALDPTSLWKKKSTASSIITFKIVIIRGRDVHNMWCCSLWTSEGSRLSFVFLWLGSWRNRHKNDKKTTFW
jgi:hypothetical protein